MAAIVEAGAEAGRGVVRRATTRDVAAFQRLVHGYAERGLMLPRSLSHLYENVRDLFVAEEGEEIVGGCSLHVSWKDLAEIRSLAVAETHQGRGYASRLVRACIEDAAGVGIDRVFALTYVPGFFERMGFVRIDKALLPRKVWTECVYCPKFHGCTEVAVIIDC
jgi:amino-acid N-acetyltransferase